MTARCYHNHGTDDQLIAENSLASAMGVSEGHATLFQSSRDMVKSKCAFTIYVNRKPVEVSESMMAKIA